MLSSTRVLDVRVNAAVTFRERILESTISDAAAAPAATPPSARVRSCGHFLLLFPLTSKQQLGANSGLSLLRTAMNALGSPWGAPATAPVSDRPRA